mmetsp:Transcript_49897/g.159651  ORF Transcript_49897/g.159651 Transcript_49897/m.159651 type:complete len:488 (-) Transcript_49897:197-1660(-)
MQASAAMGVTARPAVRLGAVRSAAVSGAPVLPARRLSMARLNRRAVKVSAVAVPMDVGTTSSDNIYNNIAMWGPQAPEHIAEWRRNLDLKAWGAEVRAIEKEIKAEQSEDDVAHLKKVLFASNVCFFAGWALAGFCTPVAAFLLSTGIFARWTMVGHHVSHGGYNAQQNQEGDRFHRKIFGKGIVRRVVDWLDWMLPEAWDVEHNNLHHYQLGEDGDPDLVERNLADIRDKKVPMLFKYLEAGILLPVWKWYYYAPNTAKEMYQSQIARAKNNAKLDQNVKQPYELEKSATFAYIIQEALFKFNFRPLADITKILAPYAIFTFGLAPLPFLLGGMAMYKTALATFILAELVTNVHSFIVIGTNHCGEDVYKFDTPVLPKTDEFYLRACIGSVNFRTANTTPGAPADKPAHWLGEVNDFMHGWLNYQIEHHMFPDMSMKSYQKAMPRVKAACEKHGVPYVQESVWIRLAKTMDIMVGKTNMLSWEAGH